MKRTQRGSRVPARGKTAIVLTLALVASVVAVVPALASHPEASLPGSNFEIDLDANLTTDDAAPSIDWDALAHPTGPELRATDEPTGQDDDSYKGGVKEDTACPGEVTGSIPNNKSDLLTFHVYEEPGDPGFVNLAWSRVTDPSGTTLMDFEFNQGSTPCAQGPNIQRTVGDLLVEYAIDQGGARAEISGRLWNGTAWGPAIDLDDSTDCDGGPCATGTISQSVILAADSDGLSTEDLEARTFGEAQIDLDLLFEEGECTVIGSAMLKSRSSDSFTSQLKDFIAPIPVDIQNCGNVIIRKQTDPDGATAVFEYDKVFDTDPVTDATFTLQDDGVQDYGGTVLFGNGYTVTEDLANLPAGWAFTSVDCSASTGVVPTIVGALVTFDINESTDVLDCTYFNELLPGAIEISKVRKHAAGGSGDQPHAGVTFTVTGGSLPAAGVEVVTGADGTVCLGNLDQATYTVTETVPAGYAGEDPKTVEVVDPSTCGDGNEAGVTFSNTPLTNVTVSVDSQIDGGTSSTISCVDAGDVELGAGSTGANGDGSVTVSDLEPTAPGDTLICTIVVDP